MLPYSPRAGRSGLTLAVIALAACADRPSPTDVRPGARAHFTAGDVILVTTATDGVNGSLRNALGTATGGEIIRFDPSLAGTTITLDTTLDVPKQVTIEGPVDKGITISGGGKHTVFHVREGATFVNVTIANGKADPDLLAGGILATGPLVLDHSTVTGNQGGAGAGIRGEFITLTNSTVTNNSVGSFESVAGVNYDFHGSLTVINSTIANNSGGSGIGPFGVTDVTPPVTLHNAIISGHKPQNCLFGILGFIYQGKNIANDESCGKASLSMVIEDPLLGALADNGGPTATLALDRNSPAINATDCDVTTDQRYVPRDTRCDIGAFEFVFTSITLAINPTGQVDPKTGSAILTGTIECSRDEVFDLALDVAQNQRVRRAPTVVHGTGIIQVACRTTAQPWIALVTPPSGQVLTNGAATATAQTVNTPTGVILATTSATIRLALVKP